MKNFRKFLKFEKREQNWELPKGAPFFGSREGAGARVFYEGAPFFQGEGAGREREHGFPTRFRTLTQSQISAQVPATKPKD